MSLITQNVSTKSSMVSLILGRFGHSRKQMPHRMICSVVPYSLVSHQDTKVWKKGLDRSAVKPNKIGNGLPHS